MTAIATRSTPAAPTRHTDTADADEGIALFRKCHRYTTARDYQASGLYPYFRAIRECGCRVAIDDFGTGYSSLSYLRQFPIDRLKIDRSFIKNALTDPDDAAIARTIVGLGHSLGLEVVAEGVETAEQEAFLVREGCDAVQGFFYGRPMPEGDLAGFVRAHRRSRFALVSA